VLEEARAAVPGVGQSFDLSPRELEVLALLSLGLTNPQIAGRLHVTVHAVKFHLAAIYRKLGVANRTAATAVYLGRASASRGRDGQPPSAGS
jgi:DNA-binding NarL/FixJ family response regulator